MKKFKFLTLTLLVLAICMTSVSATAALNPAGTYEDGVVTVTANGTAGAADATIIATRQDGNLTSSPAFTEAEILASVVYIDQIDAEEEMSVSFVPARVAEGDTVSIFMAGAGASGVEVANVSVEEEEEIIRTLTLYLNGGSLAEAAPESYPAEGYTLPIPTKAAHTFLGWYANAEFTDEAVTAIPAETEGAKEFYAKWVANVSAIASDAGYTAEAVDAEEKEGVISVTATFGNHIANVTSYGFYVYLTETAEVDRCNISATGNANSFYTVTYGIPADEFDTDVIFLPYVVVDGEYVYGEATALSVEDAKDGELKYLGTFENLEAQLGIDAE